jgi:uncharacterized phage protein gp47/JayE
MFEEFTEEYFMEQARSMGDQYGVDTRQGSVFMDAATGHCIRSAKFFNDLSTVFDMLAIDTCTGEILKEKAAQDGVNLQEATPSYYNVVFDGTTPDVGTRFFVGPYYFTLVMDSNGYMLESEIKGTETNYLASGSNVVPVYDVLGLNACTLGTLNIPGTDTETDDSLRKRWQEKVNGPAQNNNRVQYKVWAEGITGVGRAHIFPLYGGENTVMAVIYATDGSSPAQSVLDEVQEYIDPIVVGYQVTVDGVTLTFSDGLGDGVSDLGAHFLAAAPDAVSLSISFTADLRSGYTVNQAQEEVLAAIKTYLGTLVVDGDEDILIRISSIGNIISQAASILDYTPASLMINGSTESVNIGAKGVPVLEEVIISA